MILRRTLIALLPAVDGMWKVKALLLIQTGGPEEVEQQAEGCADTGVDDTGNSVRDVVGDRLGAQHNKVDTSARLNGGGGAR